MIEFQRILWFSLLLGWFILLMNTWYCPKEVLGWHWLLACIITGVLLLVGAFDKIFGWPP